MGAIGGRAADVIAIGDCVWVEYVDLEESIAASVPRYGKTKRVVSFHDFQGTPDDLESIPDRLSLLDADIVKVAITPTSFADVIRMLQVMEKVKVPFIGIAMGEIGASPAFWPRGMVLRSLFVRRAVSGGWRLGN